MGLLMRHPYNPILHNGLCVHADVAACKMTGRFRLLQVPLRSAELRRTDRDQLGRLRRIAHQYYHARVQCGNAILVLMAYYPDDQLSEVPLFLCSTLLMF
jgi:hypothetical protein